MTSLPPPLETASGDRSRPLADGSSPSGRIAVALGELTAAAAALEGDALGLLELLRALERLHRSIQDGPFRASLPADRNALFRLLEDMERSGGWPYIPRLQLRTFMDLLPQGDPLSQREGPREPSQEADPPPLAA